MTTIPQVLIEQAARQPHAIAIEDEGWKLSYTELLHEVRLCASKLSGMGLSKKERFAIWAPNCAEWVILALAGQMLGAILVPLNTRYKGVEAADILTRAKCKFLFTVQDFLGTDYVEMLADQNLPSLQETIIIKDNHGRTRYQTFIESVGSSFDEAFVKPEDISDIIFTSGTTGTPKGAMTTHAQNVAVFESFTNAIGMDTIDRYLIVNPFFHSFGYKAGWLSCLISGCTILPLAVFDPENVMARIEQDRITVMPGAPTIFQSLLDHPKRSNYDLSSLRVATTGATTIPVDLIRRMHEDLGIDHVYSAYGLTESTGVVSLCQTGDDFETIATTCGRALPGTNIRIIDNKGNDVETGDEGEIWVKGFNVMQGYLDNPTATHETITPDGWLKTGDIGTQNAQGYIKVTDRKKDMVIVGGFNCYPAEIEKTLLTHDAISDVAITGEPDDRLGEVTHAHIVMREDQELSQEDVIKWSRQNMANYKVPRGVTFHESLPRNASGKIMKFKLKK